MIPTFLDGLIVVFMNVEFHQIKKFLFFSPKRTKFLG